MSVRPVVRPRSELFLETPASGRQEQRPGGRGARRAGPLLPGGRARRPRPPPCGGEGAGGRGGRGSRGGGRFPPHPASRTTGSRCCPLPLAAPSTEASGPPLPWEPDPGRASTGRFPVRGTRSHFSRSRLEQLGPRQPELATCHLSLATSLGLFKKNNGEWGWGEAWRGSHSGNQSTGWGGVGFSFFF